MDYSKVIKFECQGSSNCCVSRGSYGFVYVSKKDIKRLSKYTNLYIKDFIHLYCDKTDGFIHFKEKLKNGNCQFLKNKRCDVYKARPTQCRTWPFWKENMNTKTWNNEIANFCPGVGKGEIIEQNNINKSLELDIRNEKEILTKNKNIKNL